MKLRLMVGLFVCLFVVVGCNDGANVPDDVPTAELMVEVATETVAAAAVVPTSEPTVLPPTETPVPTPTAVQATIAVQDQQVGNDGEIEILDLYSPEDGWVVVLAGDEVVSVQEISAETRSAITLVVDPLALTPRLTVKVTADDGDQPATGTTLVETQFGVTVTADRPVISMEDQTIEEDGIVRVESISVGEPAWVVIYNQGDFDNPLGQAYVPAGEYGDVTVSIRWREADGMLSAVVYWDEGRAGRFDADNDPVVLVRNAPYAEDFRATLPPYVLVLNQVAADGVVDVERVVSNGVGWVSISNNVNGFPTTVIGFAPLADGLNENVEILVREEQATKILYAQVHRDLGVQGEFELGTDTLVWVDNEPRAFGFDGRSGSYFIVEDSEAVEANGDVLLSIPVVVADQPAWVTMETESDRLGQVFVEAGITRNVSMVVSAESLDSPQTVRAVMYVDAGQARVLEDQSGVDFPMTQSGFPIDLPFTVTVLPSE